jgi:hypothetical protein
LVKNVFRKEYEPWNSSLHMQAFEDEKNVNNNAGGNNTDSDMDTDVSYCEVDREIIVENNYEEVKYILINDIYTSLNYFFTPSP